MASSPLDAEVRESALIQAGADRVWQLIRDFNSLPVWHPLVADSRIEAAQPGTLLGCVRNFTLEDGAVIRERLLALSDHDYSCSYSILESPMPLRDYVATVRLIPVTSSGDTVMEWGANFICDEKDRAGLVESIGGDVFAGGMRALQRRFGGGDD